MRGEVAKTEGPEPLDELVEQEDRKTESKLDSLEEPAFVSLLLTSKFFAKRNERISGEHVASSSA